MNKSIVIKVLVLVLTVTMYFNVSNLIQINRLKNNEEVLQDTIDGLESQIDDLTNQINNGETITDTCNKLYEIEIVVISESDDLNQAITHCTNESYLGNAVDEIDDEIQLVYDSRYDKEYIYGRMATSFYGVTAGYGEFYQITINTVYSTLGIDFIVLEDGSTYQFTLVRWDV